MLEHSSITKTHKIYRIYLCKYSSLSRRYGEIMINFKHLHVYFWMLAKQAALQKPVNIDITPQPSGQRSLLGRTTG